MKIKISELKSNAAELVRRMQAGEIVELTHYGNVIARVVPAVQAAATEATNALLTAKFAPAPKAADTPARLHRDPEREAAVREYHDHTGDPLVDLATMETRRRATNPTVDWPPRRKSTKGAQTWTWTEWARLRALAGLPITDNMPVPTPPLKDELEPVHTLEELDIPSLLPAPSTNAVFPVMLPFVRTVKT